MLAEALSWKAEVAEFTWRLGPKLVSQNRKCECIVEWEGRNRNTVVSQSSWE